MLQERERERSDKDSVIANLRLLLEANEEERQNGTRYRRNCPHCTIAKAVAVFCQQSAGGAEVRA